MLESIHRNNEYSIGYYSCETGLPFDETKSDEWKKGYHDKEKERLIRSIRYHLDFINGKTSTCHALIRNNSNGLGREYHCYYYGKHRECDKCYDEMLKDFLRLYVE